MKFSVIVVALNPGEKLKETIDSILSQTYQDYEIVVKDGGSKDGSVLLLPEDDRIRVFVEPDKSIYDAMNQAVEKAKGDYILFMNCGDCFYDETVLEKAAACIEREKTNEALVVYGDTYSAKNDVLLTAPGKIDGFACYRNIPCHQSCFYEAKLCKEKPYREEYRIRADYDHFLWCFYKAGAKMVHMGSTVASYEGGGYSESKENRKRDKEEHRLITEAYMKPEELSKYRKAMMLTLAPVRSFLAENKMTAWIYHWLKDAVCHHKLRIALGVAFLVAELVLYLSTGVMNEDVVSYHTGEGSWQESMGEDAAELRQQFCPQYENLEMISFLMHKEHMSSEDGEVCVSIVDEDGTALFQKELMLSQIKDGRFTDVDVNLSLSTRKKYYLVLTTVTSKEGDYPAIGLCSTDFWLPENTKLIHGEEMPGVQMVSRYAYSDALIASKLRNVLLICFVTALGIMLGLPKDRKVRRVVAYLLMLAAPYVLGQRLELLNYNEVFYLPISMKWNIGIMYVLEILVLLITHSPAFSVVFVNVVLTALYSVNYFTIMYRGTALRLNDFAAAGTAVEVMDGYSFVPNSHMAIAWGLLGIFVVFGICSMGGQSSRRLTAKVIGRRIFAYAVTITLAVVIAVCGGKKLLTTDYLNDVGFADRDYSGFSYELIYSCNGFLVASCVEIKNSRIIAPSGYSVENVEEILSRYHEEQTPADDLPHVILIMNESLADLHAVADVEVEGEYMPFINSLEENTVKGTANVSTLGGGTANSEFEVFTGCNLGFLPVNYYPYQQTLRRESDSMVSQMKDYGYETIAMHPESGRNWKRNIIYKNLKFDQILFEEAFEGVERIHHGVSDAATYDKVIELYENRNAGEKLFIFDLTIQNHGGYTASEEADEITAPQLNDPQMDEYLSLIKISDAAFEDLVKYFEKQDEKVLICMFGDHQPWIFESPIEKYPYEGAGTSAEQITMNKFKTPFVIWANYDIEEANDYNISLNYLGGLLQDIAGIPKSPYFEYLDNLRKDYPVISAKGYVDRDGNYYGWDGSGMEFLEYRMLQYNYLFDDKPAMWGY